MGEHRTQINRWIKGSRKIKLCDLKIIAQALSINIGFLLAEEEENFERVELDSPAPLIKPTKYFRP